MPAAKTTTPALTREAVEHAMGIARERIAADMAGSEFADITQLVCKLMIKRTMEELK